MNENEIISPYRKFIDVPAEELKNAVLEMCLHLGISNSGAGDYNLAALLINYQSQIRGELEHSFKAHMRSNTIK